MPHPFLSHPRPNSSLNSVNSSDSRSSGSLSHSSSPLYRYRSIAVPQQVPARLASVSSHDSGFASHDAFQSKSPSPMPSDPTSQVSPPLHLFDKFYLKCCSKVLQTYLFRNQQWCHCKHRCSSPEVSCCEHLAFLYIFFSWKLLVAVKGILTERYHCMPKTSQIVIYNSTFVKQLIIGY